MVYSDEHAEGGCICSAHAPGLLNTEYLQIKTHHCLKIELCLFNDMHAGFDGSAHTVRMKLFYLTRANTQRESSVKQLNPCAHSAEPVLHRGRASCSPVASLCLPMNGPCVCCVCVGLQGELVIQYTHTHTPSSPVLLRCWKNDDITSQPVAFYRWLSFAGPHIPAVNNTSSVFVQSVSLRRCLCVCVCVCVWVCACVYVCAAGVDCVKQLN